MPSLRRRPHPLSTLKHALRTPPNVQSPHLLHFNIMPCGVERVWITNEARNYLLQNAALFVLAHMDSGGTERFVERFFERAGDPFTSYEDAMRKIRVIKVKQTNLSDSNTNRRADVLPQS